MNERLQAVSKHTPKVIQALAESSRINLLPVGISAGNQASFEEECTLNFFIVQYG